MNFPCFLIGSVFMKVLSLNYPKLEEDEQKVNKLLENYEQKQLK